MRLDVYLTESGVYKSRARSQNAIRSGCVKVNGKKITKPSFELTGPDSYDFVCDPDPLEYVSRGALKLDFALDHFEIDVSGLTCLDIGASTGGFTQVLLERGATSVTAVDVGHGQLDELIASDPRVIVREDTDIREFSSDVLFDFISADVSFISVSLLKDKFASLLSPGGNAVVLFKPQFEVGKKYVGKGGIVRSASAAEAAMSSVIAAFSDCGLDLLGKATSPIKGGDGNTEYLLHFHLRSVS